MLFSKIRLDNFQAHRSIEVDLGRSVVTIIGPTDSGKSAVLRALRWVCLNDFAGVDFIMQGKRFARVTLTLTDGTTIVREKSRDLTTNTYRLNKRVFRSFGQGVPGEIRKAIGVNEINFQAQHDAPFWFSESAPEVSRKMNSVVDLSIIDTALANVAGQVRKAGMEVDLYTAKALELAEKREGLAPIRDRAADFQKLCMAQKALLDCRERFESLGCILGKLPSIKIQELREKRDDLMALQQSADKTRHQAKCMADLAGCIELYLKWKPKTVSPPDIAPLTKTFFQVRARAKDMENLSEIISDITQASVKVDSQRNLLAARQGKFELETEGQDCPLCGKRL